MWREILNYETSKTGGEIFAISESVSDLEKLHRAGLIVQNTKTLYRTNLISVFLFINYTTFAQENNPQ